MGSSAKGHSVMNHQESRKISDRAFSAAREPGRRRRGRAEGVGVGRGAPGERSLIRRGGAVMFTGRVVSSGGTEDAQT